ncbi:MAG: right-handed parallel beta-helix repeat-containing protein [Candidatus Hodarchaeales archaeon]|jgi:parallel beta-helix repeat protein
MVASERLQRVVIVGLAIGALILALLTVVGSILFIDWLTSPPMDDGISIESDSDFRKQNFPGSGTIEDPYIISGVHSKKKWEGIAVRGTTRYFVITDCTFTECHEGIHIEDVAPGTAQILNNTIRDGYAPEVGPQAGIVLEYADSVLVFNNTISLAGIYGIHGYGSEACAIYNNTISYHIDGIEVEDCPSSIIANNTLHQNNNAINCFQSDLVTIADNVCDENEHGGITVVASDFALISRNKCFTPSGVGIGTGIELGISNNSTVSNNVIRNYEYGIRAFGTSFCRYTHNLLRDNSEYGITLVLEAYEGGLQLNRVFLNSFIDNNPHGTSQALDDGIGNAWFDNATAEGNYWSDWSGSGPYLIAGIAAAVDQYPLDESPIAIEPF